jgi:hypothetical protein
MSPMGCLMLLLFLFLVCPPLHAASDGPTLDAGAGVEVTKADKPGERAASAVKPSDEYGNVTEEEAGSAPPAGKPSDDYGNVTEEEASGGEGPRIADPIEPWNRAMYHVNDKLYFWVLKPAATGYKYAVNEDFRGLFSNFYQNLKAPIRTRTIFCRGSSGTRESSSPVSLSTQPSALPVFETAPRNASASTAVMLISVKLLESTASASTSYGLSLGLPALVIPSGGWETGF